MRYLFLWFAEYLADIRTLALSLVDKSPGYSIDAQRAVTISRPCCKCPIYRLFGQVTTSPFTSLIPYRGLPIAGHIREQGSDIHLQVAGWPSKDRGESRIGRFEFASGDGFMGGDPSIHFIGRYADFAAPLLRRIYRLLFVVEPRCFNELSSAAVSLIVSE